MHHLQGKQKYYWEDYGLQKENMKVEKMAYNLYWKQIWYVF